MHYKPSVGIYHDCRKKNTSTGLFPIKISVTFKVKTKFEQKYYGIGVAISKEDYAAIQTTDVRGKLRKVSETIAKEKVRALDIIDTYPGISQDLFTSLFKGEYVSTSSVKFFYDRLIEYHKARGTTQGVATASDYECSLKSISVFSPGDILIVNIDKDWLDRYQSWMLSKGRSLTTVGMYLRCLRAAFNVAIDKKIVSKDYYPFGKRGYTIPKGSNIKKTMVEKDLKKYLALCPTDSYDRKALMYWKLSYYCVGMNFKDIVNLKAENIQGDSIVYYRQKTIETKREKKPIVIHIHPEARSIIKELGIHKPYLFGVINDEMTAQQKFNKLKHWRRSIVDRLQDLADKNNINQRIVVYTARHTSANKLLTNGTDIKTLQDMLGHSSLSSTEHYVSGLPYNKQKEKILQL